MKIIHLYSENIKRLKAVEITPQDNVVILSGKNSHGKSSVLDSIWLALQYRAAKKENPNPLRTGTDKGKTILDLGDYIVTRTYTKSGSSQLKVEKPDGSVIKSPQALLDGLIGDLSFDPWEFARKDDQQQRQLLGDLVFNLTNGKVDLSEFDRRRKTAYEQRTELNREKRRISGLLSNLRAPTSEEPTDEISVSELTAKLNTAIEQDRHLDELDRKLKDTKTELQEVRSQIKALLGREKELCVAVNSLGKLLEQAPPSEVQYLQTQLAEVDSRNRRAREVSEYGKLKAELNDLERQIDSCTREIELADIEKEESLEASPLPVVELKLTEDGVMVTTPEGELVPFRQASAAQRLKMSLAIAMAANPELRVIRIRDGSLLDDESMNIISQMAAAKDFQIWVEYSSRNAQDRIGVYIEDGQVD